MSIEPVPEVCGGMPTAGVVLDDMSEADLVALLREEGFGDAMGAGRKLANGCERPDAAALTNALAAWLSGTTAAEYPPPPWPEAGPALPGSAGEPSGNGLSPGQEEWRGWQQGEALDQMRPGPALAEFLHRTEGDVLRELTDDELVGTLLGWHRLDSWAAAGELAAVRELLRRRRDQAAGSGDSRDLDHLDDEVAAALRLTKRGAQHLLEEAWDLARLPGTATALAQGRIDRWKAHVIGAETTGLDTAHAAAVEAAVLPEAENRTSGQLRADARRAVLAADPSAAQRRRDAALRRARVEVWSEDAGTAAIAGRDLPPAPALAASQHVDVLARDLRAAGAVGTMDQLRARVFVSLLTGQAVPGSEGGSSAANGAGQDVPAAGPAVDVTATAGARASAAGPMTSAGWGFPGPVPGWVNLTLPLASLQGYSDAPGEVAGFGPISATDARYVAEAIARSPGSKWCLTIVDHDGRAVAHGCARSGPRPAGKPWTGGPGPPGGPGESDPGPAHGRGGHGAGPCWQLTVRLQRLAVEECDHARQSARYRPSPALRHLIRIRQPRCSFPGCRRSAMRCDEDHTKPYHRGGKTCECNLAPLCRRHHQVKQAPGWRLEQPRPGHMVWTSPSGREYPVAPVALG